MHSTSFPPYFNPRISSAVVVVYHRTFFGRLVTGFSPSEGPRMEPSIAIRTIQFSFRLGQHFLTPLPRCFHDPKAVCIFVPPPRGSCSYPPALPGYLFSRLFFWAPRAAPPPLPGCPIWRSPPPSCLYAIPLVWPQRKLAPIYSDFPGRTCNGVIVICNAFPSS